MKLITYALSALCLSTIQCSIESANREVKSASQPGDMTEHIRRLEKCGDMLNAFGSPFQRSASECEAFMQRCIKWANEVLPERTKNLPSDYIPPSEFSNPMG